MANEEVLGWDDGVNYKAIYCTKIPDLFLDKLVAKNYFSKFGKITRFILRPSRQSCTVTYETEDQAERALNGAGNFNGLTFSVDYADREEGHVQNTEEWVDAEVQAELAAMGHRAPVPVQASAATRPPPAFMPSSRPPALLQPMRPPMSALPVKASAPRPPKPAAQLPLPSKTQNKVDDGLYEDLMALIRRPTRTDEEKYRVLDARDKLMRLTMVRQTDIKKAVSTKGTCPDMCPEKERLMREFQRQVSTFEMSGNYEGEASTISHRRAIKEYSRSSADQEAPLSHELRPENVLKMTMLYLMHRIMDLCNDPQTSIADWFHFVWDRTRSIRKDITQQELCSLGAVELVEQCARFHIHCAARLVAEDPSVFDKKINAENLTKCLQSLKYMYHDLRIKGIRCPCEAEFRSYVVLLNLGDSNFLWELKQLPEHIQKSPEMKRSIAFYNALQNNNFVRFFEMIREPETSYLSACILLGYFNKLRWRAMEVITKSHNWRKNAIVLPLKYLTKILGFEDEITAADYFRYHGLQCDNEMVMLDRFKQPDIEYSMDRALKVVESKRIVSVGECVCGHALESPDILERHVPHNSFDDNGMLKALAWVADDQNGAGDASKAQVKGQQRQKEQHGSELASLSTFPSSSVRTDTDVFKIPQTSVTISPKQQQQNQPEQSGKALGSIFEKNQFSDPGTQSTTSMPDFKFSNGQPFSDTTVNANSAFGTFKPVTTGQSKSIFKVPITDSKQSTMSRPFGIQPTESDKSIFQLPAGNANATSMSIFKFTDNKMSSQPINSSSPFGTNTASIDDSSSNIFKVPSVDLKKPAISVGPSSSIFPSNRAQRVPGAGNNLFDRVGDTNASQGSIFSTAAKETAKLFQSHQFKETKPMQSDSIFAHFETGPTFPEFDDSSQTEGLMFTGIKHKKDELMLDKYATEEAQREKQQLEEKKRLQQQKAEEELKRQRLETEEKRKNTLVALQESAERTLKVELDKVIIEQVCSIAQSELARYESFEDDCETLLESLLDEISEEQITDIANEEYAMMCHDQMILCRYFERWIKYTRKKQKQRALMETTPIWVTTDTREEQTAKVMHPNQDENLQMIKRYRHGEPCNFKLLLWQSPTARAQRDLVDIFEVISSHMVRRHALKRGQLQTEKYFKLVISLPGDTDELHGFESLCNKWLRKYVKRPANSSDPDTAAYICAVERDLALCVRKVSGTPPRNEQEERVRNECDNTDGLVCLISCESLHSTRKRVHHLLKLSKIHKSVPVCFVVYDGQYNDELELSDALEMESLVEEGAVSAYKFCGCQQAKKEFSFTYQFGRALRYVARESSFCNAEADAFEMRRLQTWLELGLGEEMWGRWQESVVKNPIFAKMCCSPQHVIGLYNEALKRLRELAAEDFQDSPEFPSELHRFVPAVKMDIPLGFEHFPKDWKCPQRQEKILNILSRLALPNIKDPTSMEIEQLELWLLNYASCCISNDDEAATLASYRAIKAMIEQLNQAILQEFELAERFRMISFLSVIKAVAFVHIGVVVSEYAIDKSIQLPAEIVYRRQAFLDYQALPWWLNNEAVAAVTVDYTHEDTECSEATDKETDCAESSHQTLEQIIQQAEDVSRKVEVNLYTLKKQNANAGTIELARDLDASLYQFELAKRIGAYDAAVVQKLDENDTEMEGAVGGDNNELQQISCLGGGDGDGVRSPKQARKRKHSEKVNEFEAIMSRAFNVIEKVEAQQDQNERLHQISMLE